jgi:hypothetical protein
LEKEHENDLWMEGYDHTWLQVNLPSSHLSRRMLIKCITISLKKV